MNEAITQLLKTVDDEQLQTLASHLFAWLQTELGVAAFAGSRAKALLLASNSLDDVTLGDFGRTLPNPATMRVALYDLLESANVPVEQLPTGGSATNEVTWLALALAAYAFKTDYPLENLDPSAPPTQHSPAGQVVHQAGAWVKRQVQRSATDRDKLARKLAYSAPLVADNQQPTDNGQPATENLRPPVPVRYFEYNDEIEVDSVEPIVSVSVESSSAETSNVMRITEDEIAPADPIIHIGESRRVPRPPSEAQLRLQEASRRLQEMRIPDSVADTVNNVVRNIRGAIAAKDLKTTKLRVHVTMTQHGVGIPAVQVSVKHKGTRSEVAGTTTDSGTFLCSLPVPPNPPRGFTYEVTVTWPRDLGRESETKAITLNANRSEYELDFYSRYK